MYKLGIVGLGKMGGAILTGILNSNVLDKKDIYLSLYEDNIARYKDSGIPYTLDALDVFKNCEMVLLSIKPQQFDEALKGVENIDFEERGILSIAAGITISYLESKFKNADIIRAMPNTPALINMAVITYASNNFDSKYVSLAEKIFGSIGSFYKINENQMDATLALNGSMPAYIDLFIKAFIDKAVKDGIDYETAKGLTVESIIASCNLVLKSDDDIDTLIKNVCSKGGTTIAGLDKLYENNFVKAIEECSEACKNRSKELAK